MPLRLPAIVFIALTSVSTCAVAQDVAPDLAAGLQPYQSYDGGSIDQVNLSNGDLHVKIPLVSYAQRGGKLKLDYSLEYNGKPQVVTSTCLSGDPCTYQWGKSPLPLYTNWHLVDEQDVTKASHVLTWKNGATNYAYTMTVWMDPDGTSHPGAPVTGVTGQTGQASLDGSGFYDGYDYSSNCSTHCYTSDGDGISYHPSGTVKREDSNGNWIAVAANGNTTDTMGRTIPPIPGIPTATTPGSTSCTGSLPVFAVTTWQVPGIGGSATYMFCYAVVAVSIPDGAMGGAATGLTVNPPVTVLNAYYLVKLQSVVLPNNQAWTFEYANSPAPGQNYGDLTKIIFPTGGSISYTYNLSSVVGTTTSMWVASRTVKAQDADASGSEWQYNFSGAPTSTIVTDPVGNDTVHTFTALGANFYRETSTKWYSGSHTSGTLLKSSTTGYTTEGIYTSPDPTGGEYVAFPNSVVTTLGTSVTETDTQYTPSFTATWAPSHSGTVTRGRPTDVKVYDYGSGSKGALLQETQTAYQFQSTTDTSYLVNNLMNLVSSEDVYDGSGSHLSSTQYGYDDSSYLTASNLGTSLQLSPTILTSKRGNVTSTTRWLNGGTSPVIHRNWYDSGEPYIDSDAKSVSAATYAYSSSVFWGGLPTSVTNAARQVTQYGYDTFDVGLTTSIKDPNLQTTTYNYDEMRRPLSVGYPDTGSVGYSYDDTPSTSPSSTTPSVAVTRAITSSKNLTQTGIVDGLGRKIETQLTSDPSGTDSSDTTYDALGRVQSQSNPYRSTTEATYGITSYLYDALGKDI